MVTLDTDPEGHGFEIDDRPLPSYTTAELAVKTREQYDNVLEPQNCPECDGEVMKIDSADGKRGDKNLYRHECENGHRWIGEL